MLSLLACSSYVVRYHRGFRCTFTSLIFKDLGQLCHRADQAGGIARAVVAEAPSIEVLGLPCLRTDQAGENARTRPRYVPGLKLRRTFVAYPPGHVVGVH